MAEALQWFNAALTEEANKAGQTVVETGDGFLLNTITLHSAVLRPGLMVSIYVMKNERAEPSIYRIEFHPQGQLADEFGPHPDGAEIKSDDLRRLNFEDVYEQSMMCGFAGTRDREEFGPSTSRAYTRFRDGDMKASLEGRKRRTVTPELLAEAAEIHAKEGISAVAERFHVSKSQAHRYIAEARNQGLID